MAEWKPVNELFDFEKGTLQSSKCTSGKYTFVTAAEEWKRHADFTHNCEALIFAMAASGSLGRTHYIKGKFVASDLCFVLTPKKGLRLDLIFYHRLFNFLRSDIVKKTATGTSKLAINQTNFGAYKLPYFDYDHQQIFRNKIEKLNSIIESFSLGLDDQLILLKKLRQQILQEAIEGKLTADWRKKNSKLISGANHASKLLEKIKAEKERLIKEGKIKKDKLLVEITEAEKPFNLPDGWVWCRLGDVIYGLPRNGYSPKEVSYKTSTKSLKLGATTYGIFDRNEYKYIADNIPEDSAFWLEPGDILIQRSNSIDYVGVSAIYTGGSKEFIYPDLMMKIQIARPSSITLLHLFLSSSEIRSYFRAKAKGSQQTMPKINQGIVLHTLIPLPPLAEQHAIVERVNKIMAVIDELEKQVAERKDKSERLMQSVLREAFTQ